MTVLFLLVCIYCIYYVKSCIKKMRQLPGPFPVPVFGNLFQMLAGPTAPDKVLARFSKNYGEIYRLKIGVSEMVVLSSIEAITNIYNRDEALGRPIFGSLMERNGGVSTGIVLSEGEIWETTRRWTFKTLSSLGLRKASGVEHNIRRQLNHLLNEWETIAKSDQNTVEVTKTFLVPVSNIVWKLMVGEYITDDEGILERLIHKSDEMAKSIVVGAGITAAFPFLRFVFPKITGQDVQTDFYDDCRTVAQMTLDRARESKKSTAEGPLTLTDMYLNMMDENPDPKWLSDFHFGTLFMDLMQASSETTTSYLECLTLYSVLHEEVQENVYKEIATVIPSGEEIELNHRRLMPYTEALMLETHRCGKMLQNLVPRKTMREVKYKKYTIPKGVQLVPDMLTANNDPALWKEPLEFNPERFLDDNGQISQVAKKNCVPFGFGRRSCPGEMSAEMSAFLFYTNIVRRYKMSTVIGEPKPRSDLHVGGSSRPYPFKIVITKRT